MRRCGRAHVRLWSRRRVSQARRWTPLIKRHVQGLRAMVLHWTFDAPRVVAVFGRSGCPPLFLGCQDLVVVANKMVSDFRHFRLFKRSRFWPSQVSVQAALGIDDLEVQGHQRLGRDALQARGLLEIRGQAVESAAGHCQVGLVEVSEARDPIVGAHDHALHAVHDEERSQEPPRASFLGVLVLAREIEEHALVVDSALASGLPVVYGVIVVRY